MRCVRVACGTALAVLSITPVFAADVAFLPPPLWTGFYCGGGGGGDWGKFDIESLYLSEWVRAPGGRSAQLVLRRRVESGQRQRRGSVRECDLRIRPASRFEFRVRAVGRFGLPRQARTVRGIARESLGKHLGQHFRWPEMGCRPRDRRNAGSTWWRIGCAKLSGLRYCRMDLGERELGVLRRMLADDLRKYCG